MAEPQRKPIPKHLKAVPPPPPDVILARDKPKRAKPEKPATPAAPEQPRYLRIQDLAPLRHLGFASRRQIQGRFSGRHASPQRGHSVEFNDYRSYMPGDEMGDIDWKVFGRSDRLFVKLFEHQADMTVAILVDASASMAFRGVDHQTRTTLRKPGTPAVVPNSKYDQACRLAAAAAFLLTQQQDRVAFALAQSGLQHEHRPRSAPSHVISIARAMEKLTPRKTADLADAVRRMQPLVPPRSVLLLFSDLLDDQARTLSSLDQWLHRGGEAVVFHVAHPDELALPENAHGLFIDAETGGRVRVNHADIRDEYAQRMRSFLDTWAHACTSRGIDFNRVTTADACADALRRYLVHRAAMMR